MNVHAGNAGWETTISVSSRTAASAFGADATEVANGVRSILAEFRSADVTGSFIADTAVAVAREHSKRTNPA